MFKKMLLSFISLILLLNVSACSTNQENNESTNQIVLVDQADREIVLDQKAEKIVSSYYITTYAALTLGLEDQLVGIESKAEKRPIYTMAAPSLLDLPQVGTLKAFDVEATIALEPDLVILPKKLMDHVAALEEVGIDVLVVYPENQELLEEMILLMGKATGHEEKAQQWVDYYDTTLTELTSLLQDSAKPFVYMASNSSYMSVAGNQMYQNQLVELAGGESVSKEIESDYWSDISYEDFLMMNPEIIIVPSNATYTLEDILNDEQLKQVAAIQNQAVYQMPKGIEEWDSPIPSSILGICWLASILHEDLYSMEEMKQQAIDYYQTFYGFDLDTSLITK